MRLARNRFSKKVYHQKEHPKKAELHCIANFSSLAKRIHLRFHCLYTHVRFNVYTQSFICVLVMIHGISHSGGAPTYLQSTHTSVQHARAAPPPPFPSSSSSSPPSSSQPLHRPSKPVWKDTLTPSEREAEKAALAKLEQKAHYLRNPKYIDLHTSLYIHVYMAHSESVRVCVCVSVLSSV